MTVILNDCSVMPVFTSYLLWLGQKVKMDYFKSLSRKISWNKYADYNNVRNPNSCPLVFNCKCLSMPLCLSLGIQLRNVFFTWMYELRHNSKLINLIWIWVWFFLHAWLYYLLVVSLYHFFSVSVVWQAKRLSCQLLKEEKHAPEHACKSEFIGQCSS